MTTRKMMLAAVLLAATAGVARADEFQGASDQDGAYAAMDQQAARAQLSDPTARDSLRSHGQP